MASSNNSTPVIGIDLGTTYSVVAIIDEDGKPRVIPNSDNQRTTPSVVYIEGGCAVVGSVAKDQLQLHAAHAVQFIKPFIGRRRKSFDIDDQQWTPEELSAMILRKVVRDAQVALGLDEPPRHCIITVPAFFSEQQRKSTEDAGRIAGLDVMGIINEPTAAALAYGFDQLGSDRTVVVYDLGGGTFDVTVMRVTGDAITMLATDGDVQLGGKDWDERIIEHVAEEFEERHGIDPRDDSDALQALYFQAEQAKLRLSKLPSTRVQVACQGRTDTFDIRRDEFEELTEDLLAQTETTLQLTLDEAGVKADEVDEVLLVGGSTRMKSVRDMIQRMTGREPKLLLNPDECVAQGAAIHAVMTLLRARDEGRTDLPEPHIPPERLDRFRRLEERLINAHSLGILALDANGNRAVMPIIKRGVHIPCRKISTFQTSRDSQSQIRIIVMEGEVADPAGCTELGTLLVRGLPDGLAKGTPIEVVFSCSQDGRLSVTASLPTLNQQVQTTINRTLGLDEEAIAAAQQRLSSMVIE